MTTLLQELIADHVGLAWFLRDKTGTQARADIGPSGTYVGDVALAAIDVGVANLAIQPGKRPRFTPVASGPFNTDWSYAGVSGVGAGPPAGSYWVELWAVVGTLNPLGENLSGLGAWLSLSGAGADALRLGWDGGSGMVIGGGFSQERRFGNFIGGIGVWFQIALSLDVDATTVVIYTNGHTDNVLAGDMPSAFAGPFTDFKCGMMNQFGEGFEVGIACAAWGTGTLSETRALAHYDAGVAILREPSFRHKQRDDAFRSGGLPRNHPTSRQGSKRHGRNVYR